MSHPLTNVDDAGLMSRHLAGENDAFVELFHRLNHRLHIYAVRFLGNKEQADDIIQEVWEKVILLRKTPIFIENPPAYIFMMVRNLCLNCIKFRRRTSPFSTMDEDTHPAAATEGLSELEEVVFAALQDLPAEYREVLVLQAYSGYTLREIAALLGKSPEAIWKRASRAREKLRSSVIDMAELQHLDLPVLGGFDA